MSALKILVVDDHEPFRQSLLDFLRTQPGIEVVGIAGDGEEAIEQNEHLHPDLVLMDVSMPKLSGYDATKRIKQAHPETRVVILSSHTGEVYRSAATESLADGYIEKMSMKSALLTMLEQAHGQQPGIRVAI